MDCLKILFLFLLALCGAAHGAFPTLTYSTGTPKVQNPLSPEESQKCIVVPEGFEAVLFASEPEIVNPIAMAWDERGRCYVLQSVGYPHDLDDKNLKGKDRITILEDTNQDGRADKFTVFADDLSLATGLTCVKDGVLVCMAPSMVYLKDTNHDDKADERKILFSGFGLRDTHAGPSNLMHGFDNRLWCAVGYSSLDINIDGKKSNIGKGVFSFAPEGNDIRFEGKFNNNTWGVGLGETFDIFGSTANNNHCSYVGIPLRFQQNVPEKKRLNADFIQGHYNVKTILTEPMQQVDCRGGFTAAAGARLYTARAYPENYWNNTLLVCEPTAAVVHSAKLVKNGAGYKEVDGGNLFESIDMWCSPVYADVGPDGFVWVADWYDPVIQHNPDKRGMPNQIWNANGGKHNAHVNSLRDKTRGRVYRVAYKRAKKSTVARINPDKPEDLLAGLKSDNMFWRATAQRIIVENKMTAMVPSLIKLVEDKSKDAIGINGTAIHALWSMKGLGELEGNNKSATLAASNALKHPSPGVRKAAAMTLPKSDEAAKLLVDSKVLIDEDPHTRLAAILSAIGMPKSGTLTAALEDSNKANATNDKWLAFALQRALDKPVLEEAKGKENGAFADLEFTINTVPDKMAYDLKSIKAFAGQTVRIIFKNVDHMPHNIVFILPKTLQSFGAEVDKFLTNPDAVKNAYIPTSKSILAKSAMINPGESESIVFTIPDVAGDYPFLCTFPGHWRMMQGNMTVLKRPPGIKVLSVTSGRKNHHEDRWFVDEDRRTMNREALADFKNSPVTKDLHEKIKATDIIYLSANQRLPPESKAQIFAHVNAGKGMIIQHPGTWYNWKDWPEYNRILVGGGANSHEKLMEFEVIVKNPAHPIMKDVPAVFKIFDELYQWSQDKSGTEIEVLAIGKSLQTKAEYPVVWIVKHDKARIVCNTLGHDGRAHQLPEFKQILHNSFKWVGKVGDTVSLKNK